MKFNIKYTKLGNFFFFVSNLSEWHFSCRKQYNQKWLKNEKPMTAEKKKGLSYFSRTMKKYNFRQYLGAPFLVEDSEKKAWGKIKNIVTKKEYEKIQSIFEVFAPRFDKIWNKDKKILDNNVKVFSKENRRPCYGKIDKTLQEFFGQKISEKFKKTNVYLIKHPLENWRIAGGANLQSRGITLECNQLVYKDASSELALAVSYHEFIHLVFQNKFKKIINRAIADVGEKNILSFFGRAIDEFIMEIVINALFPRGYLANKYLHYRPFENNFKKNHEKYKLAYDLFKQNKQANFLDVIYCIVYYLYPLTEEYIESRKKIDIDYVMRIIDFLKK